MFTRDGMVSLLERRPFAPFRLHTSDGGTVDVVSPELVMPGRRLAVIGLLDPGQNDTEFDRWTTAWYMHVTRVEMIHPGRPPFTAQPPASESPSSSPT